MKYVSRHEAASAGDGFFAGQGGLIAKQNLAIRVVQLVPVCHQGGSTKTTGGS